MVRVPYLNTSNVTIQLEFICIFYFIAINLNTFNVTIQLPSPSREVRAYLHLNTSNVTIQRLKET